MKPEIFRPVSEEVAQVDGLEETVPVFLSLDGVDVFDLVVVDAVIHLNIKIEEAVHLDEILIVADALVYENAIIPKEVGFRVGYHFVEFVGGDNCSHNEKVYGEQGEKVTVT